MKFLSKTLLILSIFLLSFSWVFANNLNTWNINKTVETTNQKLDDFWNNDTSFFGVNFSWERGIKFSLVRMARDLKAVFFFIATVYFFILIIRLLFADNTEEESSNFKKWLIWVTTWVIVTQIAFSFVNTLYDEWVWWNVAFDMIDNIINPLISVLQTAASFFFIAIAIYAFYKMITANGEEDAVNSAKKSVIYAIGWFIVIRFAKDLIESTYGRLNCSNETILGIFEVKSAGRHCLQEANLEGFASIAITVINWANSLIWIVVIIMIIYAGAQVLTSAGDEEKLKKAKTSLLFIALWVALLFANYLVLTFFLLPEAVI